MRKERSIIRKKGQVTIPKFILEQFNLNEGDTLEFEVNENGEITVLPASENWFWSESWQKAEAEAEDDIKNGRVKSFNNVDDLIVDLDSDEE